MPNREELNKQAEAAGLENPEGYEHKADLQAALDKHNKAKESADSSDDNDTPTAPTVPEAGEAAAKEAELEAAAAQEQAAKDGAKGVETELGSSEEESAAARAGVGEENLDNPKQNREPKNQFEQENQPVTEQERKAAQKASDVKADTHNENAPTPGELGADDAASSAATNQGNQIAEAIAQGFKKATNGKDDFELQPEEGIDPRFSLVRNKQTQEVMLRDNGDGTLSQIQLKSIEEKEADLQGAEVEEL